MISEGEVSVNLSVQHGLCEESGDQIANINLIFTDQVPGQPQVVTLSVPVHCFKLRRKESVSTLIGLPRGLQQFVVTLQQTTESFIIQYLGVINETIPAVGRVILTEDLSCSAQGWLIVYTWYNNINFKEVVQTMIYLFTP